jgi:hypothetical protein
MLAHADMVILLGAPGLGWQSLDQPGASLQAPRLHVLNKCDVPDADACAERTQAQLTISAQRGDGVLELVQRVRELLVPSALLHSTEPWWFSDSLRQCASLARP